MGKGLTYSGGKFTGSHTTVLEKAKSLMDFLSANGNVSKIALGVIENKPGKKSPKNSIKLITKKTCLEIKFSAAGSSTQVFYIYSDNYEKLEKDLVENFPEEIKK